MMATTDVIKVEEQMYKYGEHVVMIDRRPIPISVDQFWSAFDDYLTFQKSLNLHEDTRLEPGPANGKGATISFEYRGSRTYETLLIKDDEKKVWKIHFPRPNAVFSFYEATINVYRGTGGAPDEVQAKLDGIFIEKDDQKRRALIDNVAGVWVTRIRELVNYVLDRDGLKQSHRFPIECPLEDLWKVIGDWGNIDWVVGAVGVDVQRGTPNTRTLKLESGGEVFEYEKENSEKDHKLVYVVEKSTGATPLQVYKGTVQLQTPHGNPNLVFVKYDIVFIPTKEVDPEAAYEALDKDMKRRFKILQEKYGKKPECRP